MFHKLWDRFENEAIVDTTDVTLVRVSVDPGDLFDAVAPVRPLC